MKIFAYVEQIGGAIRTVGHETVSEARRLADATSGTAHAILIGSGVSEQASELARFGADSVHVVDNRRLAEYAPEAHLRAVTEIIKSHAADVVLLSSTSRGRDLTARVAARLETNCITDVVEIENTDSGLRFRRPVYAGKVNVTVSTSGSPLVVSLRPKVFAPAESAGGGAIQPHEIAFEETDFRSVTVERHAGEGKKIELTEADIIVSGGRGIRGKCDPEDTDCIATNWQLIEGLGATLGAAVGASRAVVDAGWRPHEDQVGQTGKTVSPQLYIAVGISGAIQHLAGMRRSKNIVAINKDPDAPIFKHADLGIVGDLFEVMPSLVEQINAAKT